MASRWWGLGDIVDREINESESPERKNHLSNDQGRAILPCWADTI